MPSRGVLVLVSLQTLAIVSLIYDNERLESYFIKRAHPLQEKNFTQEHKTDAVILFTKMKSGSSIVGSIFNKRRGVTYLYEPLYPFSETPCVFALPERLSVLHAISRCQFEKVGQLYQMTRRPDTIAQCRRHNMCFAGGKTNFSEFLSRDAKICRYVGREGHICPTPIKPELINSHCKSSAVKAMKVIYLCKLEWLMPLLQSSSPNVKVIHLVRDPRATVFSRAGRKWKIKLTIKRTASQLCENLVENIKFANDKLVGSNLHQKFMRIRFEDFVLNPVEKSKKIFDFVGINMTNDVISWLKESVAVADEFNLFSNYPQHRLRKPTSVIMWRKRMPFEYVQEIQELCKPVFDWLGYKVYENQSEYRKLSQLEFIPESEIRREPKVDIS